MLDGQRGVIIGPVTRLTVLLTPQGKEAARTSMCQDYTEGLLWAMKERDRRIATIGEEEARRLGWDGPWEVRQYYG